MQSFNMRQLVRLYAVTYQHQGVHWAYLEALFAVELWQAADTQCSVTSVVCFEVLAQLSVPHLQLPCTQQQSLGSQ